MDIHSPGTYTAGFAVMNTGSFSDTYTLSCSSSGGVTCEGLSHGTLELEPSQEQEMTVTYSLTGAGTLTLTASGVNASDQGMYTITMTTAPAVTIVSPLETSAGRSVVRNRQPLVRATFVPTAGAINTFYTAVTWDGDTVTSLIRHNHKLLEWQVDSAHELTVGDSARLTVRVCDGSLNCGVVTRWVVLPNDNKPVVGFSGIPLEALGRQFAAPFGPGFSVSGAEVETAIGMPSYVSMGASRSSGLVYSTRQSYPRALVPVDLELTWPAGTPDQVKLLLWDGAVKLDSLVLPSPTCATGAARRCRAVLQGDFSASSFAAPTRKWLTVEALVTSGGSTHGSSDSVEAVLVDRRTTAYGSGWWPSGAFKLVAAGNDRVLVGPSGATTVYRGFEDSVYLSPPGDFSTLVRTASGWELRPRGSPAKLVFDANGRLYKALDQNGNRDSIAYSGSTDLVTAFVDPVGKVITLTYNSGKLTTWTDPGGRQSRITIDASNLLTYDSTSSPTTRPYTTRYAYATYAGTGTALITKRIGVIADTTVVTYDSTFRRRPAQVTLPEVQNEAGANVKPVITYVAMERQGYGVLRSLDSVYVEINDPRNNWTRSLLNRWGQGRKSWDALGLLGRTEYTPDGFVRWAEGKVSDSSRVYHDYDHLKRLVRSYIVRAASDTLRLDSLVYDFNHRVVQRIDARGKISRITYDAVGNVLSTITPNNDTTRIWYRSDGLVDSTRAPGNTKSRRFLYDVVWKNDSAALDESGLMMARTFVDAFGRDTASERKIRVQVSGTSSSWQWRRTRAFYTVANQADSTRLMRTANCADPCANPPAWPLPSDTLKTQRVSPRFDRAGRDSLRVNDRGEAVLYLYDRLGRLVSRRPWTDSMAVRDSFVYDVAGNLRKTITRRGDTITMNYDTRNRDTLTVIPGVGTLRRAFGGPLDQLTRLWYDSPVDSIGGVNGVLAWVYDQRGRLTSDTSYTGAIARATSYTYDAFERPTTTTDALGMWTVRYETNRGIPDTLLTPMGDTVRYTFDARGRAVGPAIRGAGAPFQTTPTWNEPGALKTLTHSVLGGTPWTVAMWNRKAFNDESGGSLTHRWIDRHGAGGPADTLQDSLVYDGWERVIRWAVRDAGGTDLWKDSVVFDRTGNHRSWTGIKIIFQPGSEVFDATTDRLLSKGSVSFTYDRAGNLIARSDGWTYTYDALNRLVAARKNGTLIARYAYDVLGRRIAKRVYSNTTGGIVAYTRFVYRGANVGFETDSAGAITLRYTWGVGADDLLAVADSLGNHYYAVKDRIGSVRGLVRRDGAWGFSRRYAPYGRVLDEEGGPAAPSWDLRYRWTGREYDREIEMYFFRARYYDPNVRRFVQEDPIGYAGGGNLYAYAGGNPVDRRDPSGLMWNYEASAFDPSDYAKLHGGCGEGSFNGAALNSCFGVGVLMGLRQHAGRHAFWQSRCLSTIASIGNAGCDVDPRYVQSVYLSVLLGSFCGAGPTEARACSTVRITDDCNALSCGAGNAVAWGGGINFPAGTDLGRTDVEFVAWLAHEMTHVVQWLDDPWDYDFSMFATWLGAFFTGADPYGLPPNWTNLPFSSFTREQQGEIVFRCYLGGAAACSVSPYHP